MEKTINPKRGALATIQERISNSEPIVMVNLLRFNEIANYSDGVECAGREAYATYAGQAVKRIKEAGGEMVYRGAVAGGIIAPAEEHWDEVLLVRYPSLEAFRNMISSPEYQKITTHRTAALMDSRLWLTQSL